jgi:UDP-N-acetylmuramyl pentapeptide phosphotransferase/UDP-N-acetylglucosamine-1-phosphate transferase
VLTRITLLASLLLASLLLVVPIVTRRLCRRWGLIKPNFRGDSIPSSVGLTYLLTATPVYAVLLLSPALRRDAALYLLVIVAFGGLGLADDLWGSRAVGGFRGHLRSLFALRPTTGAWKLVGGGIVALVASAVLHAPLTRHFAVLLPLLADALLIALAANALNLLDLRPGRAQFGFALLFFIPLLIVCLTRDTRLALLLVIVLAAAREWRADSRALAMMGDTGSNLLGAAAGLTAAVFLPLWGRLILLLLLIALNVAAERVSLSRVIAGNPWLNALDRRLGVR